MRVLGIETSCDETAAAVVVDSREICASVVSSQVEIHAPFGGVVPELAARNHLEAIVPVVQETLSRASLDPGEIDGVAVTRGPGLVGCLLVGVTFARSFARGLGRPVVGVNHLEGHVEAAFLEEPGLPLPVLALVVSGGHTGIWHMDAPGSFRVLARTRDDAAGEAFDKVAKLLGLGYPGGPVIDRLAEQGDPRAFFFGKVKIKNGRPDFSYSGLKTAVRHVMEREGITPLPSPDVDPPGQVVDLVASFREAAVSHLIDRTRQVAAELPVRSLVVAGGVAANSLLRRQAAALANERGWRLRIPTLALCGDNAAMIAAVGERLLAAGGNDVADLDAVPNLFLGRT
jgi:N6-L-threonylcarbamoyladenine synthase